MSKRSAPGRGVALLARGVPPRQGGRRAPRRADYGCHRVISVTTRHRGRGGEGWRRKRETARRAGERAVSTCGSRAGGGEEWVGCELPPNVVRRGSRAVVRGGSYVLPGLACARGMHVGAGFILHERAAGLRAGGISSSYCVKCWIESFSNDIRYKLLQTWKIMFINLRYRK